MAKEKAKVKVSPRYGNNPGLKGVAGGLVDFGTDVGRNVANWAGSVGDWLTSQPSRPGQGAGDLIFGRDPNQKLPASYTGYGANKADAYNKFSQFDYTKRPAGKKNNQSGGDGGSYDPASGYKAQSARDRAMLAALYNQYMKQLGGNEAGINATYAANQAALGDIYGNATNQATAAYNAARDAQTAQLQALGISDSGAMPADTFSGQLAASNRFSDLGAAAQNFSDAQRLAAIAGNQTLVNAAGAEKRTGLADFDRIARENIIAQRQAAAQAAASSAVAQAKARRDAQKYNDYMQLQYAKLAAGQRPSVDFAGLVAQGMNQGMDTDQALKYAGLFG